MNKTTSFFFSYGLKLDNGFETYNFVEKVNFKDFFYVSKLMLNLFTFQRYKINYNLKCSYIDKLLKIISEDSHQKSVMDVSKTQIKTFDKKLLFLFIH